ncbi:L-threonylcarbamoyladenylate synthase [Clostridium cellulovorans]|uniref:Threonylcarbamoyl-AMP synthase n=1 Tax=Clostridium cellulovorans (strain ATCC 35296 / DSM 3052 / OCM 3 / 743B) TaxID=573061 RepID=D9STM0_CLOC7|nr:L-threonylcarbamoyladenylate synthase [Clostridium cellulovorans]ADL52754.1 Sua5/YciO/YrdC/YwlC family protein [Clostridium cellulovorans 743B]
MDTKVLIFKENNIEKDKLREVAEVIRNGGLVAFPTETVYGLGANAFDENAVEKIFIAKGRPQDNPLIVHISQLDDIFPLVKEIPSSAKMLMDNFWPGPITFILNKETCIPYKTSAGLETIGIRMPSDPLARALIKEVGVPIAAPSANLSGKPSPTDINRCIEDLEGKVDCIIGGSNSEVGLESTIVDCTVEPPCVLRPGAITIEMIRKIQPEAYIDPALLNKADQNFKPKAPGMKYKHYAPKASVIIIKGEINKTVEKINEIVQNYIDDGIKVGIMATDETKTYYKKGEVISLGSRSDLTSIGRNLFGVLRTFDDLGVEYIISEAFEEKEYGLAIMNRLNKAAGYNIISL